MRVIEMKRPGVTDVVTGLRALADQIEAEGCTVHNLAYVVDKGDGNLDIGLLGPSPQPATTAYFLYGMGQRRLEDSV